MKKLLIFLFFILPCLIFSKPLDLFQQFSGRDDFTAFGDNLDLGENKKIDFPAFFTPNEQGCNDTWNIIAIAQGDAIAKIYIFDRFGKLVKQFSSLGPGWDG